MLEDVIVALMELAGVTSLLITVIVSAIALKDNM